MIRRTLLTVASVAIVLSLATFAGANTPKEREGIENAKTAGIKIDPAAEEAMARAPIGSCPNDPTQQKCGTTTAVIEVYPDADGHYFLEEPRPGAKAARNARVAAAPSCTFNAGVPYLAADYMQGDASHECFSQIRRHELYGTLLKWYNGQWVQMVTRSAARDDSLKIATHPRYHCASLSVWRNWRHVVDAWTRDRFGTWYHAYSDKGDQWQCG